MKNSAFQKQLNKLPGSRSSFFDEKPRAEKLELSGFFVQKIASRLDHKFAEKIAKWQVYC